MFATKPLRDLFGGPGLGLQHRDDLGPQPRPGLEPSRFGPPGGVISAVLGRERSIRPPAAPRNDLSTNGAPMAPPPPRDRRVAVTSLDPHPDLFSIRQRQRTRSKFAIAQHDHSLVTNASTHRPFRDPRQRR